MSGKGDEIEQTGTTEDKGATGGAMGGGDENPQDYDLPGASTNPAGKRRGFWERTGVRPKDPYAYKKGSYRHSYVRTERIAENPKSGRRHWRNLFH